MRTLLDTAAYRSIAQTPWATPLIYPQAIWLAAMAVLAVAALILSPSTSRPATAASSRPRKVAPG